MEDKLKCRHRQGWNCKNGVMTERDYIVCQCLQDVRFVKPNGKEYECPFFVARRERKV